MNRTINISELMIDEPLKNSPNVDRFNVLR